MNTNSDQESCTKWFRRIFGSGTGKRVVAKSNSAAAEILQKPSRNQKVLVVDDDPVFRKTAAMQLTNEGFEVLTAGDGCEAIRTVRKQKPDLVLLDMNLPVDVTGVAWNGDRVISWLYRFDAFKNIPVVMVSAGDPAKKTREALNSGATAFFHKQMTQSHLLTLVDHSLQRGTAKNPAGDTTFDYQI